MKESGKYMNHKFSGVVSEEFSNEESMQAINAVKGCIIGFLLNENSLELDFISGNTYNISGYETEKLHEIISRDKLSLVYEGDKQRVDAAIKNTVDNEDDLNMCLRIQHKNDGAKWCNLNGSIYENSEGSKKLSLVFTGASDEVRLFQSIAGETADEIYVIDKENYNLLYINDVENIFNKDIKYIGEKCYKVLYDKDRPCKFCTLKTCKPNGEIHQMPVEETGKFYNTRFWETDWNGTPAYIKYVRDVTEDITVQKEKEKLEKYFQTVLKHLPGGIAVVRHDSNGNMLPEFLSDGFADMVGMSIEDVWKMYKDNALIGVHPDDRSYLRKHLEECIEKGQQRYEMTYRLRRGEQGYFWVKATFSVIFSEGKDARVYVDYNDITEEREAQQQLRKQYEDLILQHYLTSSSNTLILGHCNITCNRILEIRDKTNSKLLDTFGYFRDDFFIGISSLIADEAEREEFLGMYLNDSATEAFERGDTELNMSCFINIPSEPNGRYVQFKVNLVETPGTGDITGILTVTDITEKIISERIFHKLSITSYDMVADVDLFKKQYAIISGKIVNDIREDDKFYNEEYLLKEHILPREREHVENILKADYILKRLDEEEAFSFSYSIENENGDILTKNLTVSAVDLRLGRVCMARTDITDSVREQQGLLNMIAYTFELACFIDLNTEMLTMHTRRTVLKNFPPYIILDYEKRIAKFAEEFCAGNNKDDIAKLFTLDVMIDGLEKSSSGYDFVFPYKGDDELRYKQVNVLWGDESHKTICLVRADVTDVLMAERQSKNILKEALMQAEKANQAKSDFLSAMSHDIRTPMNAIIGLTTLSLSYINDRDRVEEYLKKISISSKHLLSLINDILDMSKIESSKITLKHVYISVTELVEHLVFIISPQARDAGLEFKVYADSVYHKAFYGDELRINQILINLLSNAVKFTPKGGCITFVLEEIPNSGKNNKIRYKFSVKDTGIGMTEEFKQNLFEPFTRGANVSHIEGTGLGLSITKGLVDLMDGSINVTSSINKGTLFEVELEFEVTPEIDVDCTSPVINPMDDMVLNGCKFLIVEDNMINSEILCELIQMQGGDYVVKTDGMQAVEEFENNKPGTYDAILMDIQMPVMNGFEATKSIRALNREDAASIPIIAMTANAFSEDVQESLDIGMNAHVAKPVDMRELCEVIIRLVYKK